MKFDTEDPSLVPLFLSLPLLIIIFVIVEWWMVEVLTGNLVSCFSQSSGLWLKTWARLEKPVETMVYGNLTKTNLFFVRILCPIVL